MDDLEQPPPEDEIFDQDPPPPDDSSEPDEPAMTVAELNKTPFLELTIKGVLGAWDPAERDSRGWDAASRLRGKKLWDAVGAETAALIQQYIAEPRYQAKAARWVLRGVDVDRAILKGFLAQMASAFRHAESRRREVHRPPPVDIDEFLRLVT